MELYCGYWRSYCREKEIFKLYFQSTKIVMFQVKFEHEDNDGRPLEVALNHTTKNVENEEHVLIVASLSGMTFVFKYYYQSLKLN